MTTASSGTSALIRWCLGITIVIEAGLLLGMIRWDGPPLSVAGNPLEAVAAPPAFEEYAVAELFRGTPAPVDLESHPSARMLRTRLRKFAAQGPNFAGHYTVVTTGWGTNCQTVTIVDAIDGRVFFTDLVSETGVAHRIDSRLLVENPDLVQPGMEDERRLFGGPNYYVWDGRKLELIAGEDHAGAR